MNRAKRISVEISPLFFALMAWLLLYDEKGLAAGCLAASLIHECGHLSMMFWRKSPPDAIRVGLFGMRVERQDTSTLSFWDDLLIAAGGPLVNLLCFLVFWILGAETAAAIHLVIAGLNLLPVEPLDGGQILQNLLYQRLEREIADRVLLITSLSVILPLGVLGFWVLLQSGCNPSLLLVDLYLILLLLFKRRR